MATLRVREDIPVPDIETRLQPYLDHPETRVTVSVGAYYEGGFSAMYYDLVVSVDWGSLTADVFDSAFGDIGPESKWGRFVGDDPWQMFSDLRVALAAGHWLCGRFSALCPLATVEFVHPFPEDEDEDQGITLEWTEG